MNRSIRNTVLKLILLVAFCAAAPALAADADSTRSRHRPAPRAVPEFDPATGGVIAALLVGGGVLVAKRKGR